MCGVNGIGNLNEVTMNVIVSVEMFMTITVRVLSDSDQQEKKTSYPLTFNHHAHFTQLHTLICKTRDRLLKQRWTKKNDGE